MLRSAVLARIASRFSSRSTKPTATDRLRRAVTEVLEERRLFAVNPTFAASTTFFTGNEPRSIVAVDINADNNLDFVTADRDSGTVTVRRGRGDGTFRPPTSIAVGSEPMSVTVADFNKDNKLDFAVALRASDQLAVYLGGGDGATFTLAGTFAAGDLAGESFGTGAKVVTGDFNGDSNLDLAVTNIEIETVSVLLGAGNGQFGSRVVTSLSGAFDLVGVTAADFNKDGKTDLAVGSDNDLQILFAGTGGSLALSQRFASQNDAHDLVAADVTGDGILDLAVVNGHTDSLDVFKGAADGTFTLFSGAGIGLIGAQDRGPGSITAADFDGDLHIDLAVGNPTFETYVVLINDGTGRFPGEFQREVPVHTFSDEGNVPNPATLEFGSPYDIAAGDFNNDGKIDLITANEGNITRLMLNISGNAPTPVINSFTASPNPVLPGSSVTLTVNASEANGWINRVEFYLEDNATGGLQRFGANNDQDRGFGDLLNGAWTKTISAPGSVGTYTLYAVATDSLGQTVVSMIGLSVVSQLPASQPPAAPSGLTGSSVAPNQIIIQWTDNANNEGGFEIQRSLVYNFQNPTNVTVNKVDLTSYSDSSLAPNTYYYFRVRTVNAAGVSAWSSSVKIKTRSGSVAAGVPAVPGPVTAVAESSGVISVRWIDNANNETGFRAQRSTSSTFSTIDGELVFPAGSSGTGNSVGWSHGGLQPNTTYYYRVQAFNNSGSSAYSTVVSATTLPGGPTAPSAPTIGSVTATSSSSIAITWNGDGVFNETGYRIRRSTSSNFSTFTDFTVGQNVHNFTDTGLSPNTTYYYMVQAFNNVGPSAFTNALSATTFANPGGGTGPLVAPNGLTGTAGRTTVALSWNDNSNNESKWEIQISNVYNFQPATIITVNGADLENYVVQNLNPYTWYYFRVRSVNDTNVSSWSSSVKLKTLA